MRPLAYLLLVLATAGWAVVWGCNNLQRTYVPEDRFAAAYAQALCSSLEHCCSENMVSFDYDACTSGWEGSIETLLASPDAGGNYDPRVATGCVQAVSAAAAASCQPVPGSLSDARNACQGIFVGQTPLGAPCTSSSQCAPVDGGLVQCAVVPDAAGAGQLPFSAPQGMAAPGLPVCVEVSLPDGGMQCTTGASDPCLALGMYCDPDSLSCTPLNGMGGPCDPGAIASCAPGTFCMAGTCAATLPEGSPCTSSAECDFTGLCDVSNTKRCIPRSQAGQPCTEGSQCTVGVCDATTKLCLTNAIATTAACNGKNQ